MEILRFPGLGWELPISRVALSIGNLDIYWYGVIIAVGFGLGLWVYLSHNRTCGIHPDEGLDVILWAMVGAIVGARAYYVAFQWDNYKDNLKEIFNLRGGGLAIYGGIIGALIVAFIVCRIKKLPMLPVADAAFPGVMLGQAIGRWGNFFNMEAFGTNTTLPWGMTSDTISAYLSRHQAALAAQGIMVDPTLPVHPTFLYESLWNLIGVAILLLWLFPRRSYDGQITLGGVLFIVAAGLMLFIFLRGRKPMTLEYIEGQKKPRFTLGRYVDTKESRERIAALDAKLAEKKNGKKPTQPEQKEEPHEREDH